MSNVNNFLVWLGRRLFPQEKVRKSTLQQTVRRSQQNAANGAGAADMRDTGSARTVAEDPEHHEFARSKFVREDSGTHENLKIFDDNAVDSDDQNGLDPYNTGQFDRSKSWKLRS